MRTRAEQKAATRARLLDAAAVLMASQGVEGATVDAIAAEAGVTTGALYASFRSKTDLLAALVRERHEDVSRVPLKDLVAHAGERWAGALDARPVDADLLRALLQAAARDETLRDLMAAEVLRSTAALAERMEQEQLPLRLPAADAALVAQVLAAGTAVLRPVLGAALPDHLLTVAARLLAEEP
jgi:AcrR family transcriptional regulator